MTKPDPQIEMMAVADLVPYAKNSRVHDLPKIGLQQCKGRGHTRSQAKTLILLFIMSGVHNE